MFAAPMALILLALGLLLAAILALLLHKVRAIHLATYRLLDDADSTRREVETLFVQLQALAALERRLDLAGPLPPLRGWAGSPDFLLAVWEQIQRQRPQTVVECSSGASTLVIARALQQAGGGHVWSLEHEPIFASRTRELLQRHGLDGWATVLDAPLQTTHTSTPWYREEALPVDLPPVDLLVIDGPPGAVAPMARAPALERMLPRMAPSWVLLADDADRPDEAEMVEQWCARVAQLKLTRLPAEKGLVRLEMTP